MVHKVMIKQKMGNIKTSISGKKEDVSDRINDIKASSKDNMQEEVGKWRKMAPKLTLN